jgi:UDP-N-acetylmuramoyl-L-alanyl-D-glutamate--2,6-diaminopimelate ligase
MANRPPGQPAHIQPEALVAWLREHLPATGRLVSDSRRVQSGDAFFALAGHRQQGSAFIAQALDKGAAAVVFGVSAPAAGHAAVAASHAVPAAGHAQEASGGGVPGVADMSGTAAVSGQDKDFAQAREQEARAIDDMLASLHATWPSGLPVPACVVPGLAAHLGPVADAFYDHPSHALDVVAVTGTNGKTSTTHWIAQGINDLRAEAQRADGLLAADRGLDDADAGAAAVSAGADSPDAGSIGATHGAGAHDAGAPGEPVRAAAGMRRPEALIMALDGEAERDVPVPAGAGVVIGTNGVGRPGQLEYVGLTTPDALTLQTLFQQFRSNTDDPVAVVAMEASSIGIEQGRMAGTDIHTAVFTNLTRDHLDYHGSMATYGAAKQALFAWPTLQAAVVNLGDPFARHLIDVLNAHPAAPRIIGYWVNSAYRNPGETGRADDVAAKMDEHARVRLATFFLLSAQCDEVLELTQGEAPGQFVLMMFPGRHLTDFARQTVEADGQEGRDAARKQLTGSMFRNVAALQLDILGRFNHENALAAAGSWRALGWNFPRIAEGIQLLQPVPGRMEVVTLPASPAAAAADVSASAPIHDTTRPLVVVDYAHTPDALTNVLSALREVATQRGGRLCCVFGAGGNRDRGKRPDMAHAVEALADRVVVTSDNPRDEDPQRIMADVAAGLKAPAWRTEVDRRAAIDAAIADADAADVVLIAGKGRETTQEIAGVFHPFSDPDVARAALQQHWSAGAAEPVQGNTHPGESGRGDAHV